MEKTFNLDQKEAGLIAQLDQDRMQALAQVGALSLDMEQARKNLEATAERQRAFIRQAMLTRGVERFDNARVQNGALIVTISEPALPIPIAPPPAVEGVAKVVDRPNGPFIEKE